jgi:uncharacterized protein DUF839
MRFSRARMFALVPAAATAALAVTALGSSSPPGPADLSPVPANVKAPGFAAPNVLSVQLAEVRWAQGSSKLENPQSGVVSYFGYDDDGPMVPLPSAPTLEAHKTEPDKNTYLVFKNGLTGADPAYNYGTQFLFQGHEGGSPGYITRINLDADGPHRVTLLATQDSNGVPLRTIDGSTWDPFAQKLLFSSENGLNADRSGGGRIYQASLDVPATVDDLAPWIGRGGFEGMQNDARGNLYFIEDVGGSTGTGANSTARRPNSYVYRYVPSNPANLAQGGKIQALQVIGADGNPITWGDGQTADQAVLTPAVKALHTCGETFKTKWLTIATTTASSAAPGPDDNFLARAQGATPFKRPENGQFRPGSKFTELYFDETGDTDATSSANAGYGGWTTVQKLTQDPASDNGTLQVFYGGDEEHASFDNAAFFDRDHVAFVEDAGDTLHTQRAKLDSAYMFDVTQNYCGGAQPVRFLAQGRDASATLDSANGGFGRNDQDNEITGIHVSDGDPSTGGLLGGKTPRPFNPDGHWRVFYTQQHGDNSTYEIVPSPALLHGEPDDR